MLKQSIRIWQVGGGAKREERHQHEKEMDAICNMNGTALRFAEPLLQYLSFSSISISSPIRELWLGQCPIVKLSLSLKQENLFSGLSLSYNFSLSSISPRPLRFHEVIIFYFTLSLFLPFFLFSFCKNPFDTRKPL